MNKKVKIHAAGWKDGDGRRRIDKRTENIIELENNNISDRN
jgi:hypothetical protein